MEVTYFFGLQKQDKRFYVDFDETNSDKEWDTYHYGFNVRKSIVEKNRIQLKMGIGLSQEVNNSMTRNYIGPTIQAQAQDICTFGEIIDSERFSTFYVQTPVTLQFHYTKRLGISLDMQPLFSLRQKISGSLINPMLKNGFRGIECVPSASYFFGKMSLSLGIRAWQWRKIDQEYSLRQDFLDENPIYEKLNYDSFNPTKLMLMFGYRIS